MKRLDDPVLRQVVVMELSGCTVQEIADKIGLCERSIKRKRALIREVAEEL